MATSEEQQLDSIEEEVTLTNRNGLHARPATRLVETAQKFKADLIIVKDDLEVNGKSIMGILMLAAECGARLRLRASGEDAREALDAVIGLIKAGFDEFEE